VRSSDGANAYEAAREPNYAEDAGGEVCRGRQLKQGGYGKESRERFILAKRFYVLQPDCLKRQQTISRMATGTRRTRRERHSHQPQRPTHASCHADGKILQSGRLSKVSQTTLVRVRKNVFGSNCEHRYRGQAAQGRVGQSPRPVCN
jgi:hypothetical protein